jgi:hypothetical protein
MPRSNHLGASCPCCRSLQTEPFFRVDKAPIFSLVTVPSRAKAMAVPRRDIELAFCHGCGFIYNHLFDTSLDYFSLGYEDQQGFSKTFMAFVTRVATDLIERHQLQGKTLMEIGCGKGDFINLLVNLAPDAKGIGVDPAYVEGRQVNPRLSFHRETFTAKHGQLGAEFIACRHTLEHIFQAQDFMQVLNGAWPAHAKPKFFFEVPEVGRILAVPAFWDVYYEHCSYFSPGSLARLFRRTGFSVTNLCLDYGDQYVLIEAERATASNRAPLAIEESVQEQFQRVRRFQSTIGEQLSLWRTRLKGMKASGKKVVVWGGGSKAVGFLTHVADLALIEYVADINPNMADNFIPGIGCQYVPPAALAEIKPDVVIIMNEVYLREITATLTSLQVFPEILAL